MFVIGFLCIKQGQINKEILNQYSKNYNINDIIRYTIYLQNII